LREQEQALLPDEDRASSRVLPLGPLFFQLFTKGYLNYEAGEWDVARRVFEQTREMLGASRDGPSKALLDFMSGFKFESSRATPKGWPGYRELTEM